MNAKIYLDPKPDTYGKCQLFFHITGSGSRAKIFTGIKVSPENWENGTIKKREENGDLKNTMIQVKFGLINRIITEASLKMETLTPEQIKKNYLSKLQKLDTENQATKSNLLCDLMDQYEKQYKSIQKHNTIRAIKQVRNHIEKFDPTITLEEVNQSWLVRYCSYLVEAGLEDSTIKDRHLKSIKSIAKEASRNGMTVSNQIERFRWKAQPKQPFFATWEEVESIQKIKEFILPIQEKIRDLFILSCYTGLRQSDLSQINKHNLFKQGNQQMIRLKMVKTGFEYAIPLSRQVEAILNKYPNGIPKISQQEYNSQIKIVAKMVVSGKYDKVKSSGNRVEKINKNRGEMFTTHTGRRTFGRRFLDKGGSLIVLSKIFGHGNTETTLRYIGYQPQEVVAEFRKVFE